MTDYTSGKESGLMLTLSTGACISLQCQCRGIRRFRDEQGQREWRSDEAAQSELKASIERVLRLMYEEHFEVPFIGMYRKEASLSLHSHHIHLSHGPQVHTPLSQQQPPASFQHLSLCDVAWLQQICVMLCV